MIKTVKVFRSSEKEEGDAFFASPFYIMKKKIWEVFVNLLVCCLIWLYNTDEL